VENYGYKKVTGHLLVERSFEKFEKGKSNFSQILFVGVLWRHPPGSAGNSVGVLINRRRRGEGEEYGAPPHPIERAGIGTGGGGDEERRDLVRRSHY
jgi:hypothetical protein